VGLPEDAFERLIVARFLEQRQATIRPVEHMIAHAARGSP
jgi:hypothetical protein